MNAPVWLLTLAGGALADRADRRRVIAGFQSIQMLCPAAIVALLLTGHVHAWMIIALSVVVGITDALSMPSFQSIVPSIVPHDQIGRGLALNSTQFNLSRILGPSIAGVLISSAGSMACFAVSAASYIPFIGVALWILPRWTPAPPKSAAPLRDNALAGVNIILRQPQQRGALLTVLTTGVLCSPLITFIPVLVRDVFHGDARHFSIAVSAFGAGGLVGGAVLLAISQSVDRRQLTTGFGLAYAVTLVLTAVNPWLLAMPPLLVLAGASMTISNTSANTLLQATATSQLLGRTVSLYMLAMRGGISLGALLIGALVSWIGVRHALLSAGVFALAAQAIIARSWLAAPLQKEISPA